MSSPVTPGDLLSYGYCPNCGFPVYRFDAFCGGCGQPVPPAPPGSRALLTGPPGRHDPQKACPACRLVHRPDRCFCTRCGTDLRGIREWVPSPRRAPHRFENPALTLSLLILAAQTALLVGLYFAYRSDRSTTNLVFVGGVALTGVANLVRAVTLLPDGLRRARARRRSGPADR